MKAAYHVMCRECALTLKVCAKCNKSPEDGGILPPVPTPQERMKLDTEMQQMIKRLPERKRRTFLRFMNKGKKTEKEEADGEDPSAGQEDSDQPIQSTSTKDAPPAIPHTRDELLEKIRSLNLVSDGDSGSDSDDDKSFDSNFSYYSQSTSSNFEYDMHR